MPLPNFFLLGAAKAGTTSLADHLRQHPEIFVPSTKEPNYFALAGKRLPTPGPGSDAQRFLQLYLYTAADEDAYRALYANTGDAKAICDASVRYLYYPEAPERIAGARPDARFVVVLRDPVDRLYSHFCMMKQLQLEPLELEAALAAEESRKAAGWGWDWHYASVGCYTDQLERWFAHFDRERFLIAFYPDFVAEPQRVYADICRHIEVDPEFVPDRSVRGKPAYRPKRLWLDRLVNQHNPARTAARKLLPKSVVERGLERLRAWNSGPVPPLPDSVRSELNERFADELDRLGELLGEDVAARLRVATS